MKDLLYFICVLLESNADSMPIRTNRTIVLCDVLLLYLLTYMIHRAIITVAYYVDKTCASLSGSYSSCSFVPQDSVDNLIKFTRIILVLPSAL